MSRLLLRDVEVDGQRTDVALVGDRIAAVGPRLEPGDGDAVLDGGGGALLPGLWDHHIHLMALAAARRSVTVGPPEVTDRAGLTAALRRAAAARPEGWVRAVGYHESVAGDLDRDALDALLPGVPVRVQHRSGALWVLSSEALRRLALDDERAEGLERGSDGRLTGRAYGLDRWLGERLAALAPEPPPDLGAVGAELARYGVVGVTDATPVETRADLELLAEAARTGALPQRVVTTGGPPLAAVDPPAPLGQGPVKLRLADHALPALEDLAGWIADAHRGGRPVAVHCVTREALVLTLVALDEAGSAPGDRVEHGGVIPPELHGGLRRHRLTVVTQPGFVAERGDRYLVEVAPDDRPHLYPCAGLLDAGIPVGGSTDAPFGHPDPWRAIRAAVARRTRAGEVLGAAERVDPTSALGLFLSPPAEPGGPPRRVEVGAPADLVLLDRPLSEALASPAADAVRATLVAGQVVHGA